VGYRFARSSEGTHDETDGPVSSDGEGDDASPISGPVSEPPPDTPA
jgi:hypothetical protein